MEITNILTNEEWQADEWELGLSDGDQSNTESMNPSEVAQVYIERLTSGSGLHRLRPRKVQQAYEKNAEGGLFGLFVSVKLKRAWRNWTNAVLKAKGEMPVTVAELDAYIGLEMAMSLIPTTDIKELWPKSNFKETKTSKPQ
ncbi:hypothetical protein PR003_g23711 [Phytophthora rubi]|uniref:PiggyBac transposable element-derived protein domain-containing protein n=1 Tax=Phytophthora rubi TaxID=129364 RepID=A0A6A4D2J7_9STRA|nr:hypothetical protein PR001_g22687 [Phytophthora rubi]KAE9296626.1 hypothetical protein PR003_g23711 [Phytophthora rubi]